MNKSIHLDNMEPNIDHIEFFDSLTERLSNSKDYKLKIDGINLLKIVLSEKAPNDSLLVYKKWAGEGSIEGTLTSLGLNQDEVEIIAKEIKRRLVKSNLEK